MEKDKNKKKNLIQSVIILIMALIALGCGSTKNTSKVSRVASFVEGEGGWASVLINQNIKYELAFDDVLSIVTRNFEIDMISPEAGYLRTKWNTTYVRMSNGAIVKNYRVRVTIKMSKERMRIDINAEAEELRGDYWFRGHDSRLLETMKQDIAGVVGM